MDWMKGKRKEGGEKQKREAEKGPRRDEWRVEKDRKSDMSTADAIEGNRNSG